MISNHGHGVLHFYTDTVLNGATVVKRPVGKYKVEVEAKDPWGYTDTAIIHITVNGKYAPELADLGVKIFNGSNFSLQIDATDADPGDELTLKLLIYQRGWKCPRLDWWHSRRRRYRNHSVTIQVSDFSGLTDQKTYEIDVQSIFGGSAPVINDYEIPNATEDLFYSFQIGASDADPGDQITFSGINLPERLVISDSKLLSGDPDKSDVGQHIYYLVSDLSGSTNEKASIFRLKM